MMHGQWNPSSWIGRGGSLMPFVCADSRYRRLGYVEHMIDAW